MFNNNIFKLLILALFCCKSKYIDSQKISKPPSLFWLLKYKINLFESLINYDQFFFRIPL